MKGGIPVFFLRLFDILFFSYISYNKILFQDCSIYLATSWIKTMATHRIFKSSMRMFGACPFATSRVKASCAMSSMMTVRHKHDAINLRGPLMPQAWISQQMKSSTQAAPIDIDDRPRLMDLRQGEKVMWIT